MTGRRAIILLRLGRGEEALHTLEAAIAAVAAVRRDDTAQMENDLQGHYASALLELRRPADAEAPARRALAGREHLGPQHPSRAMAECLLGWSLLLTDRREEGAAALGRCLPLYRGWGQADPVIVEALEAVRVAEAL